MKRQHSTLSSPFICRQIPVQKQDHMLFHCFFTGEVEGQIVSQVLGTSFCSTEIQ